MKKLTVTEINVLSAKLDKELKENNNRILLERKNEILEKNKKELNVIERDINKLGDLIQKYSLPTYLVESARNNGINSIDAIKKLYGEYYKKQVNENSIKEFLVIANIETENLSSLIESVKYKFSI